MEIIKNISDEQWQEWCLQSEPIEFQQLPVWAKLSGGEIKCLAVLIDGQFAVGLQAVLKSVFGFKYWRAARGPIFANGQNQAQKQASLGILLKEMSNNSQKVVFWRIEPAVENANIRLNGITASIPLNPKLTRILDLNLSEEVLLGQMHQKTRYNIKLANKKGVKIRQAKLEDFEAFWKLMHETSGRDKFRIHDKNHYYKLVSESDGMIKLWLAEHENNLLAAALIAYAGDTTTYVHGASANSQRELMAPYALHWEIIKDAKIKSFQAYDLFGVDKSKWPGVTRFKEGWGGREFAYPGTFDLVVKRAYYKLYQAVRRIRRLL